MMRFWNISPLTTFRGETVSRMVLIGKIFKPRLKIMEIESVARQEAQAAGAGLAKRDVIQHTRHGLLHRVDHTL